MTAPTLPICAKLRDWPAVGDGTDALAAGTVSAMMAQAADTLEICHRALELVWSNVALEGMVGEAVATARKKLRGDK